MNCDARSNCYDCISSNKCKPFQDYLSKEGNGFIYTKISSFKEFLYGQNKPKNSIGRIAYESARKWREQDQYFR
ncbi:MAG: hypothetical protein K0R31_583 [Clostridiales bacterium]|jgi:hypothetical protein|nr:hypothetical protein [Clostridiales bacterium]